MTYLTWRQSGDKHYGERNGAVMVRLYEVNHGLTLSTDFPALFIMNWDAPTPSGWWGSEREPYEWRGTLGTTEERDALFAEARASAERTFVRWAHRVGLLPMEVAQVTVQPGDTLTVTGTMEV